MPFEPEEKETEETFSDLACPEGKLTWYGQECRKSKAQSMPIACKKDERFSGISVDKLARVMYRDFNPTSGEKGRARGDVRGDVMGRLGDPSVEDDKSFLDSVEEARDRGPNSGDDGDDTLETLIDQES